MAFCDFCQQHVPDEEAKGIGPTVTDPATGDSWTEEVLEICLSCEKERMEREANRRVTIVYTSDYTVKATMPDGTVHDVDLMDVEEDALAYLGLERAVFLYLRDKETK